MNISAYDNVKTPENLSKSAAHGKLNDLLNVNTGCEVRIFCPLCVKSFSFKFHLFEHLRTFHDNFLNRASNQILKFIECPFCNAKFYGKHLMAKHVLHYHSRVIKALFINKNRFKCYFCDANLSQENHAKVLEHFEECHFLDFEEEFCKIFFCETIQEMSMSELINSTVEEENSHSANWEDVCMNMGKNSKSDSDIKNFDEASRINCYDFTDLKQQLENIIEINDKKKFDGNSASKSILRDVKNCTVPCRSARRVLRFDIPSNSEDKENSVIERKISALKNNHLEELNLICDDNKPNFFLKSDDTFCDEPQHSSTPNSRCDKIPKSENKKTISNYKSSFKSYVSEKKVNEFEFQCGKCRLLFKENLELVSHVKNNHKKFILNAFQPCYHCAICNARFYRNHYLRKHHNLHKPY